MAYLLAIDGGGTTCRAALADAGGRILGRSSAGPANISTDRERATRNIAAAATGAVAEAGMSGQPLSRFYAYVGLAGANVVGDADAFAASLPFRKAVVNEDSIIALQGALGDGDGVMAILGTGSVYIGRQGDTIRRAGGWGFMVGDLGSGARLGRALLQDTLLAYDRILPRSELTRRVMRDFGDDPNALVNHAQHEKPGGFGHYAPLVFEYADRGDEVALSLVGGAVAHVNAALTAVIWPTCDRLCLLGGLSALYAKRIGERFQSIMKPPLGDAIAGAVQLGMRSFDLAEAGA